MSKYKNLFSPIRLGSVQVKNRIIMPAMGTNYAAADGTITRAFINHYKERAKGGCGLIIVEVTSVDYPRGKTIARQVKLNDYNDIPRWRELSDAVHAFGTKIICQLHHAGAHSDSLKASGFQPVAPSEVVNGKGEVCRALTTEEVEDLIGKYVQSAIYAQKSGLDGVELHAGHGYLLSQFLSKLTNQRIDTYGGSLEARTSIVTTIIKKIREVCGKNFLISVRLGIEDTAPNGNTLEEGVEIAKLIDAAGADLINITTGIFGVAGDAVETQDFQEGARLYMAKALKDNVKAAVSIVGKLRSPQMCEDTIAEGTADMVCLGRQLLCDAFWPQKVELGKEKEVRKCISCNEGCFGNLVFKESIVECALNPYLGMEDQLTENDTPPVANPKKVIVVGGGLAGSQAAISAAKRGHEVTLLEKSSSLGGQINIASVPPHKSDLLSVMPFLESELKRNQVEVKVCCETNTETILSHKPDAVIIATGSVPSVPLIPGIDKAVGAWNILNNSVPSPSGKNIVVIGGGTVGCETALYLAEKGNNITIIEMLPILSNGQETTHMIVESMEMQRYGIKSVTSAIVREVTGQKVIYTTQENNEEAVECDFTVVATGQKSVGMELTSVIKDAGIKCMIAGDAKDIGNIRSAIRSGFEVGFSI